MKNEVYEADYRRNDRPKETSRVFEVAVETGFFKTYNDIMRSIPKVIVPEDKKNYEELLRKLDSLAKRRGGIIRGIVNYEKFDSHIYITFSATAECEKGDRNNGIPKRSRIGTAVYRAVKQSEVCDCRYTGL